MTIGDDVTIGDYVRLGGRVKLGNDVTIGDGVTINESPVYLWPRGGQFPVYVSDADKRLVGIGCCVLEIAEWFNGAGAYLASVYKMKDTRVYEDALRTVAMMMGWEVPGGETKRCDGSTRISIAKLLAQWKGKK